MERICVYAGSSPGADPAYGAAAAALGMAIAGRGLELVYGGSHVGLMGTIADAALAAGGRVIGVIPDALRSPLPGGGSIVHDGLSELQVVASMHERKLAMMELADGFVTLPGGSGTLEELFETFTWLQLGLHGKPIGLLDVKGYWQGLVDFLEHVVDQRLLRREHADMLLVGDEPSTLLDAFEGWEPPRVGKWIDR